MSNGGATMRQMQTTVGTHRYESFDEDAVVRQLLAGHSLYMVAFMFDVSTRKVRRIARKHGIEVA